MQFEFTTASRIIFGPDTSKQVARLAAGMGRRALLVTGRNQERCLALLSQLKEQGLSSIIFQVYGEPTTDLALKGVQAAREGECDLVIGLGGGSVLDTGKVIAVLLTNRGDLMDYLEIVGRAQPLVYPGAPYLAVPTTAGTGAEVTWNAVLACPEQRVKVSMRGPLMMPTMAVVDPVLTHSLPPAITAITGLDALTQVMEPYVSCKANPLTDGICREGLRRVASSLRRAYEDGRDSSAREDMALASLFGGLALANAKLGAVHGLAGPLGGMIAAAHGAICARLLPLVMEANVRALKSRLPDSPALERYNEIARFLTGKATAQAADAIRWVKDLCAALKVERLRNFGLSEDDFPAAVAKAQRASSMKGNPITLSAEELTRILSEAI